MKTHAATIADDLKPTGSSSAYGWSALFSTSARVVGISIAAFLAGCCAFSIVYTAVELPVVYILFTPISAFILLIFGFPLLSVVLVVNSLLWWLAGKFPKTLRSRLLLSLGCFWLGTALMLCFRWNSGEWVLRASGIGAGATTGLVSGMIIASVRMAPTAADSIPAETLL